MNDKSKDIECEINNVIELVLHFDKYLLVLEEKEKKLKLSFNSKEVIKELTESKKITKFLCNDEKVKKHRNSLGIIKAINSMFFKDKSKKNIKKIVHKKINPVSFNQGSLLLNSYYYGTDAEFYFFKNIIKSKILEVIKSCFEQKFSEKEKKIKNNISNESQNNFILISHKNLNNLKKANLRNSYYKSFINKRNQYLYTKDYFIGDNSKYLDSNIINNSNITIFGNSNNRNKKNFKSNSCINIRETNINKNSSMTNDKCTNTTLKFPTIDNSRENWKKNNHSYEKRKINLLHKKKVNNLESYFMPLILMRDSKYKKEVVLKPKNIPSFSSGMMDLIYFNTKDNIKAKREKEFLNECLRESNRSLRKINDLYKSKCFVDYSKNNIIKESKDNSPKKNYESLPKEKTKFIYGFEYKSIYRYLFDEKKARVKNK